MVTRNEKPTKKCAQKTSYVNRRKKETANNRTTCAQFTYYRECHPSRRSNRRATGANTGLINANVICYSNAIFQCIASCVNLDNFADFLRSPPNEEHQHFELYYEFKSVVSSSSVVEWVVLIPACSFIFTKNVIKISTQMKVNGMTTALNNEYIFKMYF